MSVIEEIYTYIDEVELNGFNEETFNSLFMSLAFEQAQNNFVFNKLLQSRRESPSHLFEHWSETPAVPMQFFKEFQMKSFDGAGRYWESSGTTGKKSKTYYKTTSLYNLVIQKLWHAHVPKFLGHTIRLIPTHEEWPHSSLAHFFTKGMDRDSLDYHVPEWDTGSYEHEVESGFAIKYNSLAEKFLRYTGQQTPLRLVGTSYAIASVFDYIEKQGVKFQLPTDSMIIDTGGYKGIVRDRTREEFLRQSLSCLGIPEYNCLNEYGMSELCSHFWSGYPLEKEGDLTEWWSAPPWVRVRSIDPFTNKDMTGGVGVFYDLANVWSACAIQTQDLVEVRELNGQQYIRPLGRMKDAEMKGCSITAELALGAT